MSKESANHPELPRMIKPMLAQRLIELVGRLGHPLLIVPDCVVAHGMEFFAGIVRHRLEGMMAKRIDSPYLIGKRSSDWLKIKVAHTADFEVSGTSWDRPVKLTAPDGTSGHSFGYSVSISGDSAIVGARGNDESGSVYIFKRSDLGWIQQQVLTAQTSASGDNFGCSASINGDYAFVGAPRDDDSGRNSGSAYVFRLSQIAD
ncbi:hypothetical protein ACFL3Q_14000 [Planctomycetota bacterium]